MASASPYEPHLVPATLDARFFADLRHRLIGDRRYDSDPLDATPMATYAIEMIAANRRYRARTQDGRPLRRARRRWKVERFFGTLDAEWAHARVWPDSATRDRALSSFLRFYNRRRPHSAAGGRPPISRVQQVREQDI